MIRYGLFGLLQANFAVPLSRLRKVLHRQQLYLLPRLPKAIPKVLLDADQIVPVIDLHQVAGMESRLSTPEYLVLIDSECGPLALPADSTFGIVAEQKGTMTAVDEENSPWWCGEFHHQEQTFQILDIDVLAIGLAQEPPVCDPDSEGVRRNQ